MVPFCQYVCKTVSWPPHLKNKLKQISFFILVFFFKSAKISASIFNIPCQRSGGLAMHLNLICFDAGFCKMYIQLDQFFVKAFC